MVRIEISGNSVDRMMRRDTADLILALHQLDMGF